MAGHRHGRIEDYGLIGDLHTAALVGRDGSIDWLCLPRFDSGACFAALLGDGRHGYWRIAPAGALAGAARRYRDGTLVLESELRTADGAVRVVDFMPHHAEDHPHPRVVRVVEGLSGRVPMRTELVVRWDYGALAPWVSSHDDGVHIVGGPDGLRLAADVPLRAADGAPGGALAAGFEVGAGERVGFSLDWYPSHEAPPPPEDPLAALGATERWWRAWSGRCRYRDEWAGEVVRSLITLKALTYAPTGGIVAAPTTSLPEWPGGVRNWDYRYCWLRDATFALYSLLLAGYREEASAWRDWLLRAVAGDPRGLQIMYGLDGRRRLTELELGWLPGHAGSRPVREGNAAVGQLQLDVYGEVMDTLHQARRMGIPPEPAAWDLQRALLDVLESAWARPDEGLWEVRGPRRHFVHSKVMAWVALDRAIRAVERFGLDGPLTRWRRTRAEIHREVLARGYDADAGTFVQHYGTRAVDASLLLIPQVGFLPPDDPRVVGTVQAVRRRLCRDGLVMRYAVDEAPGLDGLPGREGAFLACSFWLVDALALTGRGGEARRLFERILSLRNDLGLLAEEYDVAGGRMLGNFPQAFSHVALVNSARNLSRAGGPMDERRESAASGGTQAG
ncbi:glycoside hydrolase family 15 protein [Miltoncostaea marina]|uniref:glycoside hydrolase family 15 protein n=1 Tax=Miltoncostaea marina TaxID=2843215 RepID=UPI001C3CC61E|nr:glycoside hydrolase family 15 protein [Miltoncostaea marina]